MSNKGRRIDVFKEVGILAQSDDENWYSVFCNHEGMLVCEGRNYVWNPESGQWEPMLQPRTEPGNGKGKFKKWKLEFKIGKFKITLLFEYEDGET